VPRRSRALATRSILEAESRLEQRSQLGLQGSLGQHADEAAGEGAALEDEQGGNGTHIKLRGDLGIIVDVDLGDRETSRGVVAVATVDLNESAVSCAIFSDMLVAAVK